MFTIIKEIHSTLGAIEYIFWNVSERDENHCYLAYQWLCDNWVGFKEVFEFDPSRLNSLGLIIDKDNEIRVERDNFIIKQLHNNTFMCRVWN